MLNIQSLKKTNLTKRITQTVIILCSVIGFLANADTLNANELKVGDKAPNFNLQATTGDYYTLNNYLGQTNVVIAWFPMANTRGCTIECKSLVDNGHLIREFNTKYFMVSVDPLDKNRDFARKTKADFPMLSDPAKEVARSYGVLNTKGVANRITFYIDKKGNILKIDKGINPATAAQDMAKTLQMLNIEKA